MKTALRALLYFLAGVVIYVILFFVLMVRDQPALDDFGDVEYTCASRFREEFPIYTKLGTRYFKGATFWNKIFFPAEAIYNRLRDKRDLKMEMQRRLFMSD